jgi:hypothetical protein
VVLLQPGLGHIGGVIRALRIQYRALVQRPLDFKVLITKLPFPSVAAASGSFHSSSPVPKRQSPSCSLPSPSKEVQWSPDGNVPFPLLNSSAQMVLTTGLTAGAFPMYFQTNFLPMRRH